MADFDPYYQWLAIPPKDQPPSHYRILGVELFESNADVIANAADKQMAHIRSFQAGKHSSLSQKLLNEIATAKICLLNSEKKAVYDQKLRQRAAQLRQQLATPNVSPVAPSPVAAPRTGELDFLEAPAIPFKAISLAKPKKSSDKNQLWIGGMAAVFLIIILAFNLGRNGKEVASTEPKSLPPTAVPIKKKPMAIKPKYRPEEPVKLPEERVDPSNDFPKEALKPSANSENPRAICPKKPAEPTPPPEEKVESIETAVPPKEDSQTLDASVKPKEKPSAPAKAEQEKALTTIREIYKDDYRATDQAAFAKKLIQKADESKDDLVARFVLLREAKSAAVRGDDGKLAFEVLDVLAEEYDVKVSQAKADTLEKGAIKARLPEAHRAIAEAALEVMDQAIREENFDAARQLGKQAGQLARASKDAELNKSIVAKNKEVEAVAKAFADIDDAMATLKERPNDPDANLAIGKYLCHKGDWGKGLPMLVLSSDAKLKALAEQDIRGATTSEGQVKLGDGWWSIGQGAKAEWRGAVLAHAGTWYQQAQPNLTTVLVKSLVEKRLAEVNDLGHDISTVSGKPPLAVALLNEKTALLCQSSWAKYLRVPVVQTNSIDMKLVLIPPGEFLMGSPDSEAGAASEKPQHRVRITRPYWLGATEVTQEQYQRVMGSNPSMFKWPKNPVEQVSWNEAVEFCRKLSAWPGEKAAKRRYALPTEAQWEYACRAGNPGRWYFSSRPGLLAAGGEDKSLSEYAWFDANAGGNTHPVGEEKKPNAFGLYDMHGNVWEWCADWYDEDYYAKSPADNPIGATRGSDRVSRGGSWYDSGGYCRSAHRNGSGLGGRSGNMGLRVVRVPAN